MQQIVQGGAVFFGHFRVVEMSNTNHHLGEVLCFAGNALQHFLKGFVSAAGFVHRHHLAVQHLNNSTDVQLFNDFAGIFVHTAAFNGVIIFFQNYNNAGFLVKVLEGGFYFRQAVSFFTHQGG